MSADHRSPHDTPGNDQPGDVFDEILAVRGDTVAWWRTTAALGDQLTTELTNLVRAGICTIDAANDILTHVGLARLPEPDGSDDDHDGSAPAPAWPGLTDHLALALAERDRARKRCSSTARAIRNALILAVEDGVLTRTDQSDDDQDTYRYVDELLHRLDLPGLVKAHQYTVSTTIDLHVTADDPAGARQTAWQTIYARLPSSTRRGPRITITDRDSQPDIRPVEPGRYRVRWHTTFLVSLRGAHSAALAERAIRRQTDDGIEATTTVTYLGERINPAAPPRPRLTNLAEAAHQRRRLGPTATADTALTMQEQPAGWRAVVVYETRDANA